MTLLIVDVQKDFCEGGALPCPGGREAARRISKYIEAPPYDAVVATRDWHVGLSDNGGHFSAKPDFVTTWPIHCLTYTSGADYADELQLPPRAYHIKKGLDRAAYSGFEGEYGHVSLLDLLLDLNRRGSALEDLYVCGIATSYCVKATVLDALRYGFHPILLHSLCADAPGADTETTLHELRAAGAVLT